MSIKDGQASALDLDAIAQRAATRDKMGAHCVATRETVDLLTAEVRTLREALAAAEAQCASVLRQAGAAVGVEPGAAVRHVIADRDACANERDEARDCGQRDVCAVPPGCQRHWAERASELVRERDEAREHAIASGRQMGAASQRAFRRAHPGETICDASDPAANLVDGDGCGACAWCCAQWRDRAMAEKSRGDALARAPRVVTAEGASVSYLPPPSPPDTAEVALRRVAEAVSSALDLVSCDSDCIPFGKNQRHVGRCGALRAALAALPGAGK